MTVDARPLRMLDTLSAADAGDGVETFLHHLGGPTGFRLHGRDRTRTRALVTLLHGNEPSGIRALRELVLAGTPPAVDLLCFVGSVQAALAAPGFAHRALPGCRDLNRCFRPPFDGLEGRIAASLLEEIRYARPEALIDLHNTSGAGPSYGVSTRSDPRRLTLTSIFTDHLIVTDLRLGSIMEATEDDCPTVTIECGGAGDPRADAVARAGLERFAFRDDVLAAPAAAPVVLEHPLRLELADGARVAYEDAPVHGLDVTLRSDIDRRSFTFVERGEAIGWCGSRGLDALRVRTARDTGSAVRFFAVEDDRLIATTTLRIFMVTTNPAIALSDCLFYFIPPAG